jgi:hypothetical protein
LRVHDGDWVPAQLRVEHVDGVALDLSKPGSSISQRCM